MRDDTTKAPSEGSAPVALSRRPARSRALPVFLARAGLAVAICALALLTAPAAASASFSYQNVGFFGETGSGEGQFKNSPIPERMAIDPYGNVYVADRGNSRIEIFEGSEEGGSFITKFSTAKPPLGVAVDPNTGAVYVTEAGTNEKQAITAPGSGTYTLSFEGEPTESLAAAASATAIQEALEKLPKVGPGNVLVNSSKEAIFSGGLGGENVPQLVASAGSVSTATEGAFGTVAKYVPFEESFPPFFETPYEPAPEFTAPTEAAIAAPRSANSNSTGGIAVDPTGANNFLVISGKTVKRFAAAGGAPLSSFNGSGSGTAFNDPADIAVDPTGKVLVADITSKSSARVLRFASDGSSASALSPEAPNPVVSPAGATANATGISIGVDPKSGEAFVSSKSPTAASPGLIYRYSAANTFIESFGANEELGTGLNGPITGIATRGASEESSLYVMSTSASGEPAVQVFRPKEDFPVKVEIEGEGTLQCEVFGHPAGPCAAEYIQGTELAIIAEPKEGWELSGFSGSCEGESCEVLVEEPLSVKATFKLIPPPNQPLNVGTTGSGSGEVLCRVEAGPEEPCESEYAPGTKVELIAKPALGSEFVEWREDCTGTGACELTMDKEHNVTAAFNLTGTTPVVTGLSPTSGSSGGGTVVTITGTNLAGATAVKFGTKAATGLEVKSATEVKATSPEHAAGTVHVTVSAGASTSASTAADEYTFLPAPSVSGVSPNKGPTTGGTVVTITGTNLSGAEEVKFGATAVACPKASAPNKCVVKSATEIEVESPAHAAGEVDVTVKTPGGSSATGASDKFKFETPAPTVTGVSPNKGSTAGGTVVTITGTNLSGAEEVKFGATAVTCPKAGAPNKCVVKSATEIEVESPAHPVGEVDVTVKTPGGSSATGASDKFTYVTPPAVTGISPKEGTTAGATVVTINGTNFSGATAVQFGEANAAGFEIKSANQIKATSPPHAAGTVDVTVTTPGGSSASGATDKFTYVTPPPPTRTLTIAKAGSGSGTVTCNGGACAAAYSEGTSITLAATPASGSAFAGFSGGGCSGTGACKVTINANTTVTATFNAIPPEETCATNPALCPPPTAGTAKAAATALVKAGKAALKLSCSGGPCKGSLKLTAKIKVGAKTKSMAIGKASFSLASGASKTLKVKLSSAAVKALKKAKTLKAALTGVGIQAAKLKLKGGR